MFYSEIVNKVIKVNFQLLVICCPLVIQPNICRTSYVERLIIRSLLMHLPTEVSWIQN